MLKTVTICSLFGRTILSSIKEFNICQVNIIQNSTTLFTERVFLKFVKTGIARDACY